MIPRPWVEMDRKAKLVALDTIETQLKIVCNKLALDISVELHRRGVPFRVEIEAHLVVTSNLLDPRLPEQGDVFG